MFEVFLSGFGLGIVLTFAAFNRVNRSFWKANSKQRKKKDDLIRFVWFFHHKGLVPFTSTLSGIIRILIYDVRDQELKEVAEEVLTKSEKMVKALREEIAKLNNEETTFEEAMKRTEDLIENHRREIKI